MAVTSAEGDASLSRLQKLAAAVDTLVVLMAHGRLPEVTSALAEVLGQDRPAAVVGSATLPDQQVVTGTLGDIAVQASISSLAAPATLVVGDVVAQADTNRKQVVALASFG